jgi:hypothetical protein
VAGRSVVQGVFAVDEAAGDTIETLPANSGDRLPRDSEPAVLWAAHGPDTGPPPGVTPVARLTSGNLAKV